MSNLSRSKSAWVWVLAGSGIAVLLAAIIFQCLRANPGTAAEDQTRATGSPSSSGKTRISSAENGAAQTPVARGAAAARISRNGLNLDMTITREEVAKECIERVGKEVLDSMINRTIIQLACKEEGLEVSAAEVNQEIVRLAAEFHIPIEQYLQMLQAERGISTAQYQRDVIWPMLALKKLTGNEISVTADEIKQAFQREYGPRVKARMILCDNMRRAQIAWQRVSEDPENFEKYVREFSVDPSSKSLDGSIPPIPKNSGSPNLEKAAFALKQGEISAIVQLDDAVSRYVILKCEGRTDPVVTKLDEQVQAELEDQIKKQKTQEQVAKVFESIKKTTRVDNYFTGSTTAGTKPTAGAKPGSQARPGESKSSASKSAAKPTDNRVVPAAGQGSSTNRVRPAAATNDDDLELPASGKSNTTPRTKK